MHNPLSQISPMSGSSDSFDALKKQKDMIEQAQKVNKLIKTLDMKDKFSLIADLFQEDVLGEEDALKACKTVIQQHAKVQGKADKD